MNTFIITILSLSALYFFFVAFAMSTENVRSAVVFKFIPFLLGLGSLFSALKIGSIL